MFEDITEIIEADWKTVNDYLKDGWKLLGVFTSTKSAQRADKQFYTRRYVNYVVGRAASG